MCVGIAPVDWEFGRNALREVQERGRECRAAGALAAVGLVRVVWVWWLRSWAGWLLRDHCREVHMQ